MIKYLKGLFKKDVTKELHDVSLTFEKTLDETKGLHEQALKKINQVTKATLAQSGNCSIKKLLHDMEN